MTQRYAVVGNPIAHSKSPHIHAAFAEQTGHDISYERVLAPRDGFAAAIRALITKEFAGVNVTVPFKQEAFALATQISARARAAGAANTLRFSEEGIVADNTDGAGLVQDLRANLGLQLQGAQVLLLGAGGAARGVVQPLLAAGVASITVANRTMAKAVELATQFRLCAAPLSALNHPFDVVINATSSSLSGQALQLPAAVCGPASLAYDMMYGDASTPFMHWAQRLGARTADGLGMLVEQAAEAFQFWHGVRPATATVLAQLRAQQGAGLDAAA
jgi:shikimate dehydrogenase